MFDNRFLHVGLAYMYNLRTACMLGIVFGELFKHPTT